MKTNIFLQFTLVGLLVISTEAGLTPTKQCGSNEIYNRCGTACERTCQNKDEAIPCTRQCVAGCFCDQGFIREDGDENSPCIPESDCPSEAGSCGTNEVYNECGTACERKCGTSNDPFNCIDLCVPGCFCEQGLIRDENNRCILESECPAPSCGSNEIYNECGTACERTCQNRFDNIACTKQCVPGCFCDQGFIRDENNRCILESECPAPSCGSNEIFNQCGTACERTCENRDEIFACITLCVPGCFCDAGFIRDENSRCILESECPTRCDSNEVFTQCGTACERTCQNRFEAIACTEQCVIGCFCDQGFIRENGDENSRCILESECPAPSCGENEIFNECGSGCGEPTCNGGGGGFICPAVCITGCLCEPGFFRDRPGGRCVLESECPQAENCNEDETFFVCRHPCSEPICPGYPLPPCAPGGPCSPRCFCNDGLVRHNGLCIPPAVCPPYCAEGIFQCLVDPCEFAECPNFPKARCVSNYCGGCNADFYDENDNQVKCTSCGSNEIYNRCGSACERTCQNKDEANIACTRQCVAGCFCDQGFIRDENNRCIPESECPSVSGKCLNEGEVFTECASRCGEPTCDGIPLVRCAKICTKGCLCDNENGYVRGPAGNCILTSNCPQAKKCKVGETYSICRAPCSESLCAGYQPPSISSGRPCIAGCFCNDGLVRHCGHCILPRHCPPCKVHSCLVDPCESACDAPPGTTCVANFCGGCNAIFYDHKCQEVDCHGKPSY